MKTETPGDLVALRLKTKKQVAVCERAEREIAGLKERVKRISLMMDLDSVPDLDLDKLWAAPAFDFAHDICGIIHHMDRTTYPGTLKDCFVPRCCNCPALAVQSGS